MLAIKKAGQSARSLVVVVVFMMDFVIQLSNFFFMM